MACDQTVGLVARVDDERAIAVLAPDDPAVLLERPDGEAADVHQLLACCFRFCARVYTNRSVTYAIGV